MECNIEYDGRVFTDSSQFQAYMMSKLVKGKRYVDIPPDHTEALLGQTRRHISFDDSDVYNDDGEVVDQRHDYIFNATGEKFTSATQMVDQFLPFSGKPTEEGKASRRAGTVYHNIFQAVMQGRREMDKTGKGKLDDILIQEIPYEEKVTGKEQKMQIPLRELITPGGVKYNPAFKKIYDHAHKLYEEWTKDGSIVMSEFLIGNVSSKLAGTVDIGIIHPDGSVTLYDFKGSRHPYTGPDSYQQKKNSNNFQLNLYREMLSVGDNVLGIPPLNIRDAFIIPLESSIKSNGDNPILEDVTIEEPINIGNREIFHKDDIYRQMAQSIIQPEDIITDLVASGVPNFGEFADGVSGFIDYENQSPETIAQKRLNNIQKDKDGYFFFDSSSKKIHFENPEARTSDSAQAQAERLRELIEFFTLERESRDEHFAKNVIAAFYNPGHEVFNGGNAVDNIRQKRVKQLLDRYNPVADRMVLARKIPGLANAGADVIVVYRNYDDSKGTYTHIDLLSVDQYINDIIDVKEDQRGSIFGRVLSRNRAENIATTIEGNSTLRVMENNRKTNTLMKLGMIGMALKQATPDLKIGNVISYSVNSMQQREHNVWVDQTSMRTIIDHVKIMNKAGITDTFSTEMQSLLKDENLLDGDVYKQSDTESYLSFLDLVLRRGSEKDLTSETEGQKGADTLESTRAWYKFRIGGMLADTGSKDMREFARHIQRNSEDKKELMRLLDDRARYIKGEYTKKGGNTEAAYKNDREYGMIARAIVELDLLSPSLDNITDISKAEAFISSGGMVGVEIVDAFVNKVKHAHNMASSYLLKNYVREKKKRFDKLLHNNKVLGKARNLMAGDTTRFYDRLIETVEVPTVDGRSTVTRKTMRFKDENSPELTEEERDFIKWYNDQVEDALTRTMSEAEKDKFKQNWVRGHIPLLRSSTSNMVYKSIKETKAGYGNVLSLMKNMWKMETDKHVDRTDYFTNEEGIDKVVNFFEDQVPRSRASYDEKFGDTTRMKRMGFVDVGGQVRALTGEGSTVETNLERVLDVLQVTSTSKLFLEPLLPTHKAVQQVIHMVQNEKLNKLTNLEQYLKVYGDATILNMRQHVLGKEVEAGFRGFASLTSTAAVGWNIFSGIKNFLSGHFQVLGNTVASAAAGDLRFKSHASAYAKTFGWMTSMKKDDSNKLHSIMYENLIANVDLDDIRNSLTLKSGSNHIFSSRFAFWLNHAGDYFHRSHMAVTEMVADGVWDAYEKKFVDGEEVWQYNEDLDKRWSGPDGKKRLEAYKSVMKQEGKVDDSGRLTSPYTLNEINKMKKQANLTFENSNIADSAIYKHYVLSSMLGQMRGWLASRSERWWKIGKTYQEMGHWEYITDDKGDVVPVWKGHYMEGMVQTWMHVGHSLRMMFTGKEDLTPRQIWQSLKPHQKENIGRTVYDVAIAGMLMALVQALFDDDNEDTVVFYVLSGAVEEIFMLDQLSSAGDIFTDPFISIGISMRLLEDIMSLDPERMAFASSKLMGFAKVPFQVIEAHEDIVQISR